MKHAIVEKLRRELREPITSERQVVYLLVEIRKLMEMLDDGPSFPALKFACDWVAHPVMDRSEAKRIVRQIDKAQQIIEEANYDLTTGTRVQRDHLAELGEHLKLSKFREQLSDYLVRHGLDYSIADDNAKWANFLRYYAAVVEDCPLKCFAPGLKYADEAVLKVVEVVSDPEEQAGKGYQLAIEWRWKSKVRGKETYFTQRY